MADVAEATALTELSSADPSPRSETAGDGAAEGGKKPSGRRKRSHVPADARKRVKLACESCRRIKVKCDGSAPCGQCTTTRRTCRYVSLPASPVVRQIGGGVEGSERHKLELLERLFVRLHPDMSTDVAALQGYAEEGLRRRESETARVQDNDEASLVLGNSPMPPASMTVLNQGKTHFEGKFSYWTFFHSVRQAVTDDMDAEPSRDEGDYDDTYPLLGALADWKTGVLAALPPREAVDFLVTTFFRSAQANHFYIHPEVFSRKLYAFYSGTHEFDMQSAANARRSAEFISVLFMVFAIGSQFAELEEGDPLGSGSGSGSGSGGSGSSGAFDLARLAVPEPAPMPGWRFYQVSRRLLADVICSSSMTSIQVCVLQGIFLPSTKSRDAGYNLLGLALRMAVNMGLHRACGAASLHPHVRELRNRLWWSVYVAERLYSVEMGRPLSISDGEIDAPFPVDMPAWDFAGPTAAGDGGNSGGGGGAGAGRAPAGHAPPTPPPPPATNVDNLIAMARLCRLLGKIVEAVYCRPADADTGSADTAGADADTADPTATIIRPRVFQQLKRELDQSRSELPPQLRLPSALADPRTPLSRSVAHIALTYEQATILLTRSCLHYAAAATRSGASGLRAEAVHFLRQQSQDCRQAAVASLQILAALHTRSLLCRFSFHDALYCTAALYVLLLGDKLAWLVCPPLPPAAPGIPQGLLILRDLAKGSEAAASALRYIVRALQARHKEAARRGGSHGWSTAAGRDDNADGPDGRDPFADDPEARHERGRRALKVWLTQAETAPATTVVPTAPATPALGSVHPLARTELSRDVHLHVPLTRPVEPVLPSHGNHGGHLGSLHQHPHAHGHSLHPVDFDFDADLAELQPFWVHDHSDLNLLSRDLSGMPDFSYDGSGFL